MQGFVVETKTQDTHIAYNPLACFLGYVIYSFINNIICLDYLDTLQHKLYAYGIKFEKLSSMICMSWVFLKF